jgi:hypothetical protein
MARLAALFRSRPWHELRPDDSHAVLTGGLGEFRGLDYTAAALTSDRSTLIAYTPVSRVLTVDLAKLSGSLVQAWWFSPRDGKTTNAGRFSAAGSRDFPPPANEGDWVLVVDDVAKGRSAPGS